MSENKMACIFRLPCKVGSNVLVSMDALPLSMLEYTEDDDIPKFAHGRVVSFRKNAKGEYIKIAVREKWMHEWFDPETGNEMDFFDGEKLFSYPISQFGKTIFLDKQEDGIKEC